jgi:hypothetical protein
MIVEAFIICDAATQSGGKLNVLGAFDTINARGMPMAHPHCAIALRIRFSRIEQGEYPIRINLIDQDGQHVIPPLDGVTRVTMDDDRDSAVTNLILNINGLTFRDFGRYAVDLMVGGKQIATLPLHVRATPGHAEQLD